ncbi:hypothetical protein GJ699_13625 [Duganella sp. FT80W]|uniref:Phage coat protein n=1 Tax=Duganella guangzhouensis TaxID=2666084 RepID=A0A6I2KZQ2_9BURK|nr:hypothetical protein [Duganella guangzhouensis]MRW91030.1 hypothetical protein [Duganella guangzhouensis]
MKKQITSVAVIGALVMAASANAADTVDVSAITGAFSASDIVTGVMAISGTLAVVYVSIKAARTVLGMLRGR